MILFSPPSAAEPYILPCRYTWEWAPSKSIQVYAVDGLSEYKLGTLTHMAGQNLEANCNFSCLPEGRVFDLALRWEDGTPFPAQDIRGASSFDVPYDAEIVCDIISQLSDGWNLIEIKSEGAIPPESIRIRNNGELYWHRLPAEPDGRQAALVWFWSPKGSLPTVDTPGVKLSKGIRWKDR